MTLTYTVNTGIKLLPNESFMETIQSTQYLVSNYGRVFSIQSNRLLQPGLGGKSPYYNLSLHGKTYNIHRLVKQAFHQDSYFDGAVVDHIDGNPLNNILSNLEWVTTQENAKRAYALGLYTKLSPEKKRESNKKVGDKKQKLTSDEIYEIQEILDEYPPNNNASMIFKQLRYTLVKELSDKYNVSISVINRIAGRVGRYGV